MGEADVQEGFRVSGKVQGVGFRWWTVRTAGVLGLRGTVRNLPSGDVEVHAAGDAVRLESFAAELRRGPIHARVDGVERIGSTAELPEGFEVVY